MMKKRREIRCRDDEGACRWRFARRDAGWPWRRNARRYAGRHVGRTAGNMPMGARADCLAFPAVCRGLVASRPARRNSHNSHNSFRKDEHQWLSRSDSPARRREETPVLPDCRGRGFGPRDGRYVERVGTYNPMVPKDHDQRLTLKSDRITYWLGQGAQPTERVQKMLAGAGLAEAPVIREQPKSRRPARSAPSVRPKPPPRRQMLPRKPLPRKPLPRSPAEEAPAEEAAAEEAPAEEAAVKRLLLLKSCCLKRLLLRRGRRGIVRGVMITGRLRIGRSPAPMG